MSLTDDQMHRVYDVAVAVNALEARLRRVEAREGGQAADPVEAPTVEDRLEAMQATWQIMSESYTDACAEAKRLRAERDAAQARVAELEAALREAVGIIAAGDLVERSAFVRYVPYVTGGELDALRAALDKEATDAH